MKRVDVLIIGAGPTGLGAAYQLDRQQGVDWLLCEQGEAFGGLSRSIVDESGYTWDIGGHVWFSHFDVFTKLLEKTLGADGFFKHKRDAAIHYDSRWVPYPFQDNLHALSEADRDVCLAGLVSAAVKSAAGSVPTPENFSEFIDATFGEGIARAFMRPYNKKVWAWALEDMSCSWVGERVSVPDPVRAVSNTVSGRANREWGPNSTFMFPKTGGTGQFWRGLGAGLPQERVRFGAKAVAIDLAEKTVTFEDGSAIAYGHLITTAPLDVTACMTGEPALVSATSGLAHTSVHVVGLGVDRRVGDALGTRSWMYFTEEGVPFYRVTNFSHYSPAHVPEGVNGSSLLVEVAESSTRPVDVARIADEVIAGLISVGMLRDTSEVSHVWTHRAEYGYPIPTLGRDEAVNQTLAALEARDVFSRGRFGAWRYEVGNMDHSFMQGYEAAARVLTGCAELVVWHPSLVNQPHPVLGLGRYR